MNSKNRPPLGTWCLFPAPSEELTHVKGGLDGRERLPKSQVQELLRALVSQVSRENGVSLWPPSKPCCSVSSAEST